MLDVILSVVRTYQTLLAAGLGLLGAAILAPRISARYARDQAYWSRRLNFHGELIELWMSIKSFPVSPPDGWNEITPDAHPERDEYLRRAFKLGARGKAIYPVESIEHDAISLLPYLALLPAQQHAGILMSIAALVGGETRGESVMDRFHYLQQILQEANELRRVLAEADSDEEQGVMIERQAQKALGRIADRMISRLRRWSAVRPWHWARWFRFERGIREEAQRIREATS